MAIILYVTILNVLLPQLKYCVLRKGSVEDLSTVPIGYIKDKHPDRLDENQRFRVLFDSGCSATMINKKFVKHWKKQPSQNHKVVYQSR
jgi:hypothetical protein